MVSDHVQRLFSLLWRLPTLFSYLILGELLLNVHSRRGGRSWVYTAEEGSGAGDATAAVGRGILVQFWLREFSYVSQPFSAWKRSVNCYIRVLHIQYREAHHLIVCISVLSGRLLENHMWPSGSPHYHLNMGADTSMLETTNWKCHLH